MSQSKERYTYSTDNLKFIVEELIVWRDGLAVLKDNMFSKAILKRIDGMLELKKFEETTITYHDIESDKVNQI